jgi:hypothetical protein
LEGIEGALNVNICIYKRKYGELSCRSPLEAGGGDYVKKIILIILLNINDLDLIV